MKRLNSLKVLILLSCATLVFSCAKIANLVSVDFEYNNADLTFTIPASTSGTAVINGSSMYFNADSLIKSQSSQLSINNIKSLYVKSCQVDITAASQGQDLSALESCSLSVFTANSTTPIEIASLTNNPDVATKTLTIPVNSTTDLSTLLKNNTTLSYKITVKTRRAVTTTTDCKATLKFNIKAGL